MLGSCCRAVKPAVCQLTFYGVRQESVTPPSSLGPGRAGLGPGPSSTLTPSRRPSLAVGAREQSPQVSLASAFAAEGARGTPLSGVALSPNPYAEGAPSEAGSMVRTSRPPGRRPSLLSVLKCARTVLAPRITEVPSMRL